MTTLYRTTATAVGGRNGHVRSDDGLFEAQLAMPNALGGKGGATNPEQLFAAGYAACFGNAVLHVARAQKIALRDADVEVVAEIGIGPRAAGGFQLSAALQVTLSGVEQSVAEQVVARHTRYARIRTRRAATSTSRWACTCAERREGATR